MKELPFRWGATEILLAMISLHLLVQIVFSISWPLIQDGPIMHYIG